MSIDVNNESDFEVNELEISSQAQFVLRSLHINPAAELSVLLVDEIAMTTLHEKFMDEPGPTDVLSFPMDMPAAAGDAVTLGDIVIAPTVAARQAATAGHSFEHEVYILAAHGLLHILGYDHANKEDEKVMFALQEDLVKNWQASA